MTALILLSKWQESQVEFWRKSVFEGYDVSSQGRIRSYWIIVGNRHRSGAHAELSAEAKIIQGAAGDSSGYPYLNVRGTIRSCPKIHRLVALAFISNPENKAEVNHKTGVKVNNWAENLEWATHQENIDHAWRTGLRDGVMPKGDSHYNSKISDDRILEMQRLYDQGIKPIELAQFFDVTLANVYDLARGVRGRGKTLREKNTCRDF